MSAPVTFGRVEMDRTKGHPHRWTHVLIDGWLVVAIEAGHTSMAMLYAGRRLLFSVDGTSAQDAVDRLMAELRSLSGALADVLP